MHGHNHNIYPGKTRTKSIVKASAWVSGCICSFFMTELLRWYKHYSVSSRIQGIWEQVKCLSVQLQKRERWVWHIAPAILVYYCACLLSPARCDYSSGDDDANLSFFLPGEDGDVRGGNNTIRSGHSLPTLSSWPLRQHWTLPRPNISGFSCRPPPPPPPPLHWRIVLGLNWKFSGEIFKNLHKKTTNSDFGTDWKMKKSKLLVALF